jgi:hypothetical protein
MLVIQFSTPVPEDEFKDTMVMTGLKDDIWRIQIISFDVNEIQAKILS